MAYSRQMSDPGFDPSSVDVDLEEAAAQVGRLTGWLQDEEPMGMPAGATPYSASGIPTYDEATIIDYIKKMDDADSWLYRLMPRFHDQDGEGSCVYNGLAHACEVTGVKMFGIENFVWLSPMSGYRHNARGPNSGSIVSGAIKWSEAKGLLPARDDPANVEKFKHTHPNVGWRAKFQDGWEETALNFRAQEWFWVESRLEWYSALLNGCACVGGRKGHCVCHLGLTMDGRTIYSIYGNSWGNWGSSLPCFDNKEIRTFGYDSPRLVDTMCSRGGWAIRTMRKPSYLAVAA